MARVHTSRFAARAGTKLPGVTTVDGVTKLRCGNPRLPAHYIAKGDAYHWFAPGFRGMTHIRCTQAACRPRASELDASLYSEVLAAQEDASDNLAKLDTTLEPDDVTSAVDDELQVVRDAIESVADQYESAAEGIGDAGQQFQDWADSLREAEVMSWQATDYDSFDHTPDHDAHATEDDATVSPDDCDTCQSELDDARRDWASGLIDEASTYINDVSKE